APKTKSHRHGRWLFQFGVCRETTMPLRSALILCAVLVVGSTSASIAAGAKHSEHDKSYTRAPMRARSMAPRIESGGNAKRQTLHDRGAEVVHTGQRVSVVTA